LQHGGEFQSYRVPLLLVLLRLRNGQRPATRPARGCGVWAELGRPGAIHACMGNPESTLSSVIG
jgi:hypothetical protein